MNKKNLFSIVLASIFAGCATAPLPDVVTHYDPYTHFRTDLIPENLLEINGTPRELVWLNASRVFKDIRDFDYYLEVHYEAREETGYLNINPGVSLVVLADERELKFNGAGSLNNRKESRGVVAEDALYLVGPNELRAIAGAKQVKVKVIGRNGIVERDFTPANSAKFKKFVEHFVDGGSR